MTLEDQCFHAVVNLRIAHEQQTISDYSKIMKYYNPEVKAFDLILDKISEAEAEIQRLTELLNS
jgi:hypothetical protein